MACSRTFQEAVLPLPEGPTIIMPWRMSCIWYSCSSFSTHSGAGT